MRSFWTEIKYIKNATRVLGRDSVNRRGLDLSKEVLWVSVDQRKADLRYQIWRSIKHSADQPGLNPLRPQWADRQNFFYDLQL